MPYPAPIPIIPGGGVQYWPRPNEAHYQGFHRAPAPPPAVERVGRQLVIRCNRLPDNLDQALNRVNFDNCLEICLHDQPSYALLITVLECLGQCEDPPRLTFINELRMNESLTQAHIDQAVRMIELTEQLDTAPRLKRRILLPLLTEGLSRSLSDRIESYRAVSPQARKVEGADIKFRVKEFTFSANRTLLASNGGPVMQALLLSGFKEAEQTDIRLEEVDPIAFTELLRYIETGTAAMSRLSIEQGLKLAKLAQFYQLPVLGSHVDLHLAKHCSNPENAFEALSQSAEFPLPRSRAQWTLSLIEELEQGNVELPSEYSQRATQIDWLLQQVIDRARGISALGNEVPAGAIRV